MNMSADGLPPINSPAPAAPIIPGVTPFTPMARGVPAPNPVGRPSTDPEQQQQRVERTQAARRLDTITPNRAKDQKLKVFRVDNSGRVRGREVLTLLATDIEKHLSTMPEDGRDDALDDLIAQRLPESCEDGIYKCQWFDKTGAPLRDPPPWEVPIGDIEGETEEEELDDMNDAPPAATLPVQQAFPQPPPAPAQLDLGAAARAIRDAQEHENRRGNETMTMIMSMQQQNQQMMATMMQMQTANQQAQMQYAQQQEERDRQRRAEFRNTLLTMLPTLLPFLTQMFGPKEKAGISAEMNVLLEMVKGMASNKGTDAAMMENMIKLQGEMTKNQLALQAQGASAAVTMQAEASALVFKNLMNTMKEVMENKPAAEPKDDSTMSMIARVAGPIIAQAMQNNAQAQQAAPEMTQQAPPPPQRVVRRAPPVEKQAPPPPPAEPVAQTSAPVEQEPPAEGGQRVRRRVARQAPPDDPTKYTDDKRVEGCLKTVRALALGQINPGNRWKAIQWLSRWMPPVMIEAVKARDKAKVQELGTVAALSNGEILQWLTDDENQKFLEDAIEDVRVLVSGELTEAIAEASIIKGGQFVQRRQAALRAQQQQQQAAIDRHNNPPDVGEGRQVVQDATLPSTQSAPPSASVVDATPVKTQTPPPTDPPTPGATAQ